MTGFLKFTGGRRRGSVTLAALLAYLGATIGVPVPGSVEKDHSRRYPCEHHACGCATADQCWKSCCCFSAKEKLAWAEENHVAAPKELLAQVEADVRPTLKQGSCCTHHRQSVAAAPTCCESHGCEAKLEGSKHCAKQRDCDQHGHHAAAHVDDDGHGITLVIGALARHCQGLSDLWTLGGPTLPPAVVAWEYQWDVLGWIQPDATSFYRGALPPPVPPPRLA